MTLEIKHDGGLQIATGRSRKELHWKNREWQWSAFLNRVCETHRTAETVAQYASEKKARQDEIKDIGGFVGGYVNNGKRKNGNILNRQLITLDIDFGDVSVWDNFEMLYGNAACMYSTHKHTPINQRLRIIIPLDREVNVDEYVAISRKVAGDLDINIFDDTTFEPTRLMYWPSTSKDGEYVFRHMDAPWLSADDVLNSYNNWQDASEWPVSDRAGQLIHREIKKQDDPLEKPGIVGAFCRTFDIHEAIAEFLPDKYDECDVENRYTYVGGSTAAGLVVYDDKFAYSHHGTDPVSGKLCNAFDLVRIHLFGLKDEDAKEGTQGTHLPSYMAMTEFATKDVKVRKQIGVERMLEMRLEFAQELQDAGLDVEDEEGLLESDDIEWLANMDVDKFGKNKPTINNVKLIFENDPMLKGKFALNLFEQRECITGNLPWRRYTYNGRYMCDGDDAGIRHYIENNYGISSKEKIKDALDIVVKANSFHPVKEYLDGLQWDGQERLEQIFINYLGAEDSKYIRTITRKTFVAAVSRIYVPGIKYDNITVFVGKQGIGKSTLIKKLGKSWYSDSFVTVMGKEAFEQIQGVWIVEMGELAGLKKAEIEATKHFISKQEDRYRVAYGRRTENYPRQCIFIGSTNEDDFLRDPTGNRRFWPVDTYVQEPCLSVFDDLPESEIDQIWAEAVCLFKGGESNYLDKVIEKEAAKQQQRHTEVDDRSGVILEFLNTPITSNWYDMELYDRKNYYLNPEAIKERGVVPRMRVCVAEIWCELFQNKAVEMNKYNTKELHNMMRNIEGWKQSKNPVNIQLYGRQRAYYRVGETSDGIHQFAREHEIAAAEKWDE